MENTKKMQIDQIIEKIKTYPVIPVFYHDDVEVCKQVLKACYDGGIRVFEFVNRGKNAEANFKALVDYKKDAMPELTLGIGTILDPATAESFLALGTEFLVSPIFVAELAEIAKANNCLWIPGCMTPTEIANAMFAGCGFVKLFPGETLGTGFLKGIKPLFPTMKFMPTGGVDVEESNIKNWFAAGVTSVGMGSKLFKQQDGEYNLEEISANCRKVLGWATA
ncbi:bifunctional 4-hydroxy-2-oxoglutarate aldolase/2-dehydro-3-deoxy-phosphogluconate aldolase [Sphingobacterium sp.]|uniref:bifunctional 4-hydroxy-2-oxoglutarate aldolase/2-dehydro-3-deoxy-phosphogluconate aldolase n=1 Tax=Sphingobacterium sp. TaxID=341027 RepID=UPI00289A6990|nr:bifunctional 4-hydroxy-2-oxoglutarate aldolase/2-dehydro-3-deoxy-phosphogluconate aldolase [Sphingobacterium sp.]